MALRTKNGLLSFERDDDLIYIPVAIADGADIAQEARIMSYYYRAASIFRDDNVDLSKLSGQLFIWGHGDKGFRAIGTSKAQSLCTEIAKDLERKGLPDGKDVILWSCWAGSESGLAESLWLSFQGTSLKNITVYGPKYATGTMTDFPSPDKYERGLWIYDQESKPAGDLAIDSKSGDKKLKGKVHAKPEHLRGISDRSGIRSAEV